MKPLVMNEVGFKTANDIFFNVKLRGNIVVVRGDSGTGKSYFCSSIVTFKNSDIYPDNSIEQWIDKIEVIDASIGKNVDILNILRNKSGKLIVIDNGDILLNDNVVEHIVFDMKNQYLIFCREDFAFHITPNYYGEFVNKNNCITLRYFYSEEGWI